MIFATVGSQLPFDRKVHMVNNWAAKNSSIDILAQIGESDTEFPALKCQKTMVTHEYNKMVENAELIIAHAGTGSIFTALEYQKPIIIFPRSGDLGETRNNHQFSTMDKFGGKKGIYTAFDEKELHALLDQHIESPLESGSDTMSPEYERLTNYLSKLFDEM